MHQQHESSASSCDHFRNAKRRQAFCLKVKNRRAEWRLVLSFPHSEWMHSLIYGYIMRILRLLLFVSPDHNASMSLLTTAAMPPLYRRLDEEEMTSVWSPAA